MIKLIGFLFSGCWHKWTIIEKGVLHYSSDLGGSGTCNQYTLQCEHCGNIKVRNTK